MPARPLAGLSVSARPGLRAVIACPLVGVRFCPCTLRGAPRGRASPEGALRVESSVAASGTKVPLATSPGCPIRLVIEETVEVPNRGEGVVRPSTVDAPAEIHEAGAPRSTVGRPGRAGPKSVAVWANALPRVLSARPGCVVQPRCMLNVNMRSASMRAYTGPESRNCSHSGPYRGR